MTSKHPHAGHQTHPISPRVWGWVGWPLLLGAGFVLLLLLWGPAGPGSWRHLIDAEVYRGGAALFIAGGDVYGTAVVTAEGPLPFTYPPAAALVFTPLLLVPGHAAGVLLVLLSVVCWWWVWAVVLPGRPAVVRAWAWCLSLMSFTLVATLSLGQINMVLWGLVVADVLRAEDPRWRRWGVGVGVGIAGAIKLTPLVFVLVFLVRRDVRALVGVIGGFVAATGAAVLLRPELAAEFFLEHMRNASRVGDVAFAANLSLRGVLARLGSAQLVEVLWPVLCLLVVAVGVWAIVRATSLTLQTVLCACVGVLVSPISWDHHWVFLPVAVVALWAVGMRWLAVWAALLCAVPARPDFVGEGLVAWLWGAHAATWALVVLVAVGVSCSPSRGR